MTSQHITNICWAPTYVGDLSTYVQHMFITLNICWHVQHMLITASITFGTFALLHFCTPAARELTLHFCSTFVFICWQVLELWWHASMAAVLVAKTTALKRMTRPIQSLLMQC